MLTTSALVPPSHLARLEPPSWVHLLPAGVLRTQDGRGPYRVADPAALIAASMSRGKLPIDENHATDLAAPRGQPSPARGWIVRLEQRSDGIWGRVEWTGQGRQIMEDRQYRGISPVIAHRKDGTIIGILRASLTNTPNFNGLASLNGEGVAGPRQRLRQMLRPLDQFLAEEPALQSALGAADERVIRLMGIDRGQYLTTLQVERAAKEMVSQHATGAIRDGLTTADERVIRMMGLDRSEYVRSLKRAQEGS